MTEENASKSTKKPIYKRIWVWALVIVLAVGGYYAVTKKDGGGTINNVEF